MLALFVLAGVAVASPVFRTLSMLLVVLLVAGTFVGGLVGRYGARSVSLAFLAVAGVLAPMNGLRFGAAVTFADLFLVPSAVLAVVARTQRAAGASTDRPPIRPDVLAALLLVGGGLVGSRFAVDLGASLSAILRFGVAAVGLPLVFLLLEPTRQELRGLAWAFIVGASVNSIMGIITYDPFDRGIGLSTHSNHLALGAVLASGLAVGLFLSSAGRSAHAAAACWAVLSLGILKSGSRAGAFGAAVLIVVILLSTGSARIIRWCVVAVVGIVALLQVGMIEIDKQNAVARLLGRDPSTVEMSNQGRAQLRAEAIAAIKKHPYVGTGFEDARVAHNLYLQVWAAAGMAGLLGLAVLWRAAVASVLRAAVADRFLLGSAAGAVSFLALAFASNILWDRYLWFALAVFVTARGQLDRANEADAVPPSVTAISPASPQLV